MAILRQHSVIDIETERTKKKTLKNIEVGNDNPYVCLNISICIVFLLQYLYL